MVISSTCICHLQIEPCATLLRPCHVKYESNTKTPLANRLNTYALVCEEVRTIVLFVRPTLMYTAQAMEIGAPDKEKGKKGKGKKGDKGKGKRQGRQPSESPRGQRD